MTDHAAIRVGIVEDRTELRHSLAILIGGTTGLACTGAYRSMEEAVPALAHARPQVLLVDIGLPGMSGIEGIRLLKKQYTDLLFVVLSVHDDDERIFEALCAGACGYLLKDTAPSRLIDSIKEVVAGGSPMSPAVARRVTALFRRFKPPPRVEYDLTPHEERLVRMLVEGHNYRTAAEDLGVSVNTISFHMRRIYEKLQVHSKSEAVSKALREGLIR